MLSLLGSGNDLWALWSFGVGCPEIGTRVPISWMANMREGGTCSGGGGGCVGCVGCFADWENEIKLTCVR